MDLAFSANLGFLWQELPLPEAIRAAHRSGFAAVECHWPGDTPADEVRAALDETGLPILGINTRRGPPGENGLAALPGREAEARAAIDAALAYAERVDAEAVHVMCGNAEGEASRFEALLTEYEKAPRVTRNRLYLEAIEEVYGNSNKVIIDSEGSGNMIYLPLDQLTRGAGRIAPGADANRNSTGQAPVVVDEAAREQSEDRDRRTRQ